MADFPEYKTTGLTGADHIRAMHGKAKIQDTTRLVHLDVTGTNVIRDGQIIGAVVHHTVEMPSKPIPERSAEP